MAPTSTQGQDNKSIYVPIDLQVLSASNKSTTSIQEGHYKKVPHGVSPLEGHSAWRKPCSIPKMYEWSHVNRASVSLSLFFISVVGEGRRLSVKFHCKFWAIYSISFPPTQAAEGWPRQSALPQLSCQLAAHWRHQQDVKQWEERSVYFSPVCTYLWHYLLTSGNILSQLCFSLLAVHY